MKYKYIEIENYILENIYSGIFKPDSLLPTQGELCRQFGVSRMTVAKAINNIQKMGLLEIVQGSGTYVRMVHLEQQTIVMSSFTERYEKLGIKVSSDLVYYARTKYIDSNLRKELKVSQKEEFHHIKRMRYGNGKIMAIQFLYIPVSRIPVIDLSSLKKSFYAYVEKELKMKLGNGKSNVTVVLPNEEVRTSLQLEKGVPVVLTKHISCFANGLPFEYIETYQRFETYSLDFYNNRLL